MKKRTAIIGDVHGCLEELDELLKLVRDCRVILLGDLIDRGPDPVGVVRRARELRLECVLGNHEEKALRWMRNEADRRASGRKNGMQAPSPQRQQEWESLSKDDVLWLHSLPTTITVSGWLVVHAGLEPMKPLAEQLPDRVVRCQYVTRDGEYVGHRGGFEQQDGTVFWTSLWPGPLNVVYGHSVHSYTDPFVTKRPQGVRCVGIETGCVFGGRLTAMVIGPGTQEYVQVQAKRAYTRPRRELG